VPASGGTSGGAGVPVEPLDCPSNPLLATGSIDGIAISSGSPHFPGFSPGNYWKTAQLFGEFQVWAWGTQFLPAPTGSGHARRGDIHYCVGAIGASVPFNGTIAYSSFSKIGSCAGATGPSGTVKYCKALSDEGTEHQGCYAEGAHLWGVVGTRNVDHSGDLGEIPGLFTSFEAFGVGAIVFLEKSVPWGDLDHGFVRTEIDGEQVTFCVKGVSDLSDDSADHFELGVTELGTCPGVPVSGNLKGCL
jgi:hypothetical protein